MGPDQSTIDASETTSSLNMAIALWNNLLSPIGLNISTSVNASLSASSALDTSQRELL